MSTPSTISASPAGKRAEAPARQTAGKIAWADGGPLLIPADAPRTFTEALRRTASRFPDREIICIAADGSQEILTYAQLWSEARRFLAGLREEGLGQGSRVIFQIESLRHHFITFWACVLGGITPVTVAVPPSYRERNGVVNKLLNTWGLLEKPAILASERLAPEIRDLQRWTEQQELRVIAVEPLAQAAPTDDIHPALPEDLVFFQLTSGSTGVPKCIQETHRGVIHHIHGSQQFNGYSPDDVTLNWLPMDHVVPILTFHLKDTYLGCKQIHVKTERVLAEPLRWLDLIEQHKATHSWAPNFGFKLLADRLAKSPGRSWDASSMKFFMNAGEQVTLPVVKDFLERTRAFGIRSEAMQPAFGMAEACTCMTYQNHFTAATAVRTFRKDSLSGQLAEIAPGDPGGITFVDLGPPVPGVEIRIADSQNRLLPEGRIGRFQIRGAVITPGYLLNPKANEEAFVGDGWFNSGDLGFILYGRLTLTGREKEMIIIRGANFYCYEIEDVVNQAPGVEPTFSAACAVDDKAAATEGLAIFFVPRDEQAVSPELVTAIKVAVSKNLGIQPLHVVPIARVDFPKTTSGKIQRTQLKKTFEAGKLPSLLQPAATAAANTTAASADEGKIAEIWQETLGVGHIGLDDPFFAHGDSLKAMQIIARVQSAFSVDVPISALFGEASTIRAMAKHVASATAKGAASLPPISPAAPGEPMQLSFPQERAWLLDQLQPGTAVYNVATGIWLEGRIDVGALEQSLAKIAQRHPVLRTVFHLRFGKLNAAEKESRPLIVERLPKNLDNSESAAWEAAVKAAQTPFDLSAEPPIRALLIPVTPQKSLLAVIIHQIAVDGWSLQVFLKELASHYAAFARRAAPSLPPLSVGYADYAAWQRKHLTAAELEPHLQYWTGQLKEAPPLAFPEDARRPETRTWQGATETSVIGGEALSRLKELAKSEGATLFTALLAAFNALLRLRCGQDDVVVGSAAAGRNRIELENLIGFFVNTLALRARMKPGMTFRELVQQVRSTVFESQAHQSAPFEQVMERLQANRPREKTSLLRAWFAVNEPLAEREAGGVFFTPKKIITPLTQFDLTLFVTERSGALSIDWEYSTDLFDSGAIAEMIQGFNTLIAHFAAHPDKPLKSLTDGIFSRPAVPDGADTTGFSELPHFDCIHQWIEEQVRLRPSHAAVTCAGKTLTYAELDEKAHRLACRLVRAGAGPDARVPLFVRRSVDLLAGILGILKAGAAYVPVDPDYPRSRIEFLIQDIGAEMIVCDAASAAQVPKGQAKIIPITSAEDDTTTAETPLPPAGPDNLAYVIYTSGSTGNPKGALVTHRNLVYSNRARLEYYAQPVGRYLMVSSPSFDSSVAGIFWTLCSGGTLVLPEEGGHNDPARLRELIALEKATHFLAIPALHQHVLTAALPGQLDSLQTVIVAGESCPKALVNRHFSAIPNARLFNEYGPTEASVWCAVFECKADDPREVVPIGQPIPGTTLYLLNDDLHPVTGAGQGEIVVSSPGVARGYWNREELTRERFIPDPRLPGARMYRTGDLGQWQPDGNLSFLGRKDGQVKISGYRIELEEIEAALAAHPAIREAAVLARTNLSPLRKKIAAALLALPADQQETLLAEAKNSPSSQVSKNTPPLPPAQQTAALSPADTENRSARRDDFELTLRVKNPSFVRPPRESQRNWLLNRAMNEFASDLQALDTLAAKFIPGGEMELSSLMADRSQADLSEDEILEDWHIPLMRAMAKAATESRGDVLEIGFGRGISATMIQEFGPRSHTIVECNQSIVDRFFNPWRAARPEADIRLLFGKWQEVESQFGLYNGVFFQAYPLNEAEFVDYLSKSSTFAEHFFPTASRYLRKGGVFTYLTHEIDSLSRQHQRLLFQHFSSFSLSLERLEVPADSKDLWWSDTMVVVKAIK